MKSMNQIMGNQKGESLALNMTLALIVIVIAFSSWKFGVPYFQFMRFAHYVQKQVDYDAENERIDSSMLQLIYDRIQNKAISMKLPVRGDHIQIDRETDRINVNVEYTEHINLFVYEFDWKFKIDKISEGLGIRAQ